MTDSIYPVPEHAKATSFLTPDKYQEMYQQSVSSPDEFWKEQSSIVDWIKEPTIIKNTNFAKENLEIKWFEDGQLNLSYNCIDRHLATQANQTAIIWEGDSPDSDAHISYQMLHDEVCKLANGLKSLGVEKGVPAVPALLLGAGEYAPIDMAVMYQSIAAGGFRMPLRSIRDIVDANGEPLRRYPLEYDRTASLQAVHLLHFALRAVVREGTGRGVYQYLPQDFDVAGKKLNHSKRAANIPVAAAACRAPDMHILVLSIQNTIRFHMVMPRAWSISPTYHSHKPGRERRAYEGYRTLSFGSIDLRVAEGLWAERNLEQIWLMAGCTQLGGTDSLFVVLIDIDAMLTREDLGLPCGSFDVDLEEAFDTVWQPDIICPAHEIPNLSCEDLGLVGAMLAENQVSVRTVAFQSEAVPCHDPEGRKLSPAFFVAAVSVFS